VKKKSPPYAIIGAVVLGLIAMLAYFSHEKSVRDQAAADLAKAKDEAARLLAEAQNKPPPPTTVVNEANTHMRPVLFASQPIDPGVRISPSFIDSKQTPEGVLPDAYTDSTKDEFVLGAVATRHIEKGDPFTPRNVGKTLPVMSTRISPGMRAVSLQVFNADSNRTGGFVVDGDKVDLLATTSSAAGVMLKAEMIMQNVDVLYVPGPTIRTEKTDGVNPMPSPGGGVSVTFEVTPEQAQALIALGALTDVKIYMILRSREDKLETKIKPWSREDYIDGRLGKIQRMTDTSIQRVQELQKQIQAQEALEKNQAQQGNTNATPKPASP